MKIRVTMKCPDSLEDAIESQVDQDADNMDEIVEKFKALSKRWFEYGEYLTVEIDTEEETCIVVEDH